MWYNRRRIADERRGREMTFMSFHLSPMSFGGKKPALTWGFEVFHNLNLRQIALLICSPPAHGLRVFGGLNHSTNACCSRFERDASSTPVDDTVERK